MGGEAGRGLVPQSAARGEFGFGLSVCYRILATRSLNNTEARALKILVAAQTSKDGGSLTFLTNLLRAIGDAPAQDDWVFWIPQLLHDAFSVPSNVQMEFEQDSPDRKLYNFVANFKKRRNDRDRIFDLCQRHQPDVVFVVTEFGFPGLAVPQVVLVRNRIYYDREWLSELDSIPQKLNILFRRLLAHRAMKAADHVLFPSKSMQDQVCSTLSLQTPSSVIHYGGPIDVTPRTVAPSDNLRLLNISHYWPQKNLVTLLEAVKLLHDQGVGIRLALTGDPSNSPGSRARRDQELVRELAGVVTITPNLPYKQALELYRSTDVFVFPSTCESFGHPMIEALFQGVPVVAAETAINREICGDAARYFPARDPEALSKLLLKMKVDGLPTVDTEDVRRRFNWTSYLESLSRVLHEVAESR